MVLRADNYGQGARSCGSKRECAKGFEQSLRRDHLDKRVVFSGGVGGWCVGLDRYDKMWPDVSQKNKLRDGLLC